MKSIIQLKSICSFQELQALVADVPQLRQDAPSHQSSSKIAPAPEQNEEDRWPVLSINFAGSPAIQSDFNAMMKLSH